MKLTSVKLSALSLMALAMTACTSNEEVAMPQPKSNQIGFSVVTNNLTRASNSYCSTNLPARIKVTAYNNGKNYYGDAFDEITKSEADGTVSWTGTTDRYWPRVDDDSWQGLNFFAYVKDDALSENAEATENKIVLPAEGAEVLSPKVENFTVKENVAEQIDLMYATTANRKNTGAVPLNFRHALSQVCFKAQNLDPRIKSLVINKIEIYGLTSRGDYQFPTASTYVTPTPTHDATGVPTGAGEKGKWSLSEASDYTNKTFSIENLGIQNEDGSYPGIHVTCPKKDASTNKYDQPDAVNISVPQMTGENNDQHEAVTETSNPYKNALNLIPQVVSPMVTEGDGGAYFKINVTMKVSEKSDVSESTEEELESLEAQTKDIIVPVDIDWEEGNRYIYTFIWEDNGHVTYQARFADFDNVKESTQAEPKNVIKGTTISSAGSFIIKVNGNPITVTPVDNKFSVYCGDEPITSLSFSMENFDEDWYSDYENNGSQIIKTLDLSSIDTSKVTNMERMFYACENLTSLDLSGFDTSKVTNMSEMFNMCHGLTSLDLSGFDTSKVTNMSWMFDACYKLTSLDLSSFDTSKVTNMSRMFHSCTNLTSLDLSSFDTSKVTNMSRMFHSCTNLTSLDLSNFSASSEPSISNMFKDVLPSASITTNSNFKKYVSENIEDFGWTGSIDSWTITTE